MKVHSKIKEILKEFEYLRLTDKKLKLIVVDNSIAIYEIKDKDNEVHTINIISNVPMFRNSKITDLLYKTPIFFSHSFGGEDVFIFRLNDYTNENELTQLN
tara:strand:- start:172 stop:474 length:303 start_codon:yes stop_codon:yes gene_type:complete